MLWNGDVFQTPLSYNVAKWIVHTLSPTLLLLLLPSSSPFPSLSPSSSPFPSLSPSLPPYLPLLSPPPRVALLVVWASPTIFVASCGSTFNSTPAERFKSTSSLTSTVSLYDGISAEKQVTSWRYLCCVVSLLLQSDIQLSRSLPPSPPPLFLYVPFPSLPISLSLPSTRWGVACDGSWYSEYQQSSQLRSLQHRSYSGWHWSSRGLLCDCLRWLVRSYCLYHNGQLHPVHHLHYRVEDKVQEVGVVILLKPHPLHGGVVHWYTG